MGTFRRSSSVFAIRFWDHTPRNQTTNSLAFYEFEIGWNFCGPQMPIGKGLYFSVQTSRGCPNNCDFCDVIRVMGRKYRSKSIDQLWRGEKCPCIRR